MLSDRTKVGGTSSSTMMDRTTSSTNGLNPDRGDQHEIVAEMQPVDLDHQKVERGQIGAAMKSARRTADSATNLREAADFEPPDPRGASTSPSSSRTARPNRCVDTLISIRFIARRPSQSSCAAVSQLGIVTSRPSTPRTRGRSTSILPPWKPIRPRVRPQRCPLRRAASRSWRGPQAAVTSASIILPSALPQGRTDRSSPALLQTLRPQPRSPCKMEISLRSCRRRCKAI
ncbi:hypothetical protein AB7M43_002827 [Bradyrhizobium elkanii]